MHEHTFRNVSRIEKEYFQALCREAGLHGSYDCLTEPERPGRGETFTIVCSGRETYMVFQKVSVAANG